MGCNWEIHHSIHYIIASSSGVASRSQPALPIVQKRDRPFTLSPRLSISFAGLFFSASEFSRCHRRPSPPTAHGSRDGFDLPVAFFNSVSVPFQGLQPFLFVPLLPDLLLLLNPKACSSISEALWLSQPVCFSTRYHSFSTDSILGTVNSSDKAERNRQFGSVRRPRLPAYRQQSLLTPDLPAPSQPYDAWVCPLKHDELLTESSLRVA